MTTLRKYQQGIQMTAKEKAELHQSCKNYIVNRYLIYADDYITWNEKIDDWNNNDEFTGTYLDAHEYATKKYGKKYTIHDITTI
jgi:hypothetical protein